MSDSFDPRDELTERLAALGRQPVDPALQSQHLTAMAGVPAARSFRTSLAGRLKVGAGVLAGFLLGASGLTAAGAMGPLQPIAASVASEVANVEVPQGPKDKAEKAAKVEAEKAAKARLADGSIGTQRDWSDSCVNAGTEGKYAGNRGLYLKQIREDGGDLEAAKASTCGMPVGGDDAGTEAPEVESEDDAKKDDAGKSDEDHGKSADAPGKTDDPASAGKAKGDEASDDAGDQGDENKPETPAGPPDEAGKSGVEPPVVDPPAEPAPDTPAGDAGDGEV